MSYRKALGRVVLTIGAIAVLSGAPEDSYASGDKAQYITRDQVEQRLQWYLVDKPQTLEGGELRKDLVIIDLSDKDDSHANDQKVKGIRDGKKDFAVFSYDDNGLRKFLWYIDYRGNGREYGTAFAGNYAEFPGWTTFNKNLKRFNTPDEEISILVDEQLGESIYKRGTVTVYKSTQEPSPTPQPTEQPTPKSIEKGYQPSVPTHEKVFPTKKAVFEYLTQLKKDGIICEFDPNVTIKTERISGHRTQITDIRLGNTYSQSRHARCPMPNRPYNRAAQSFSLGYRSIRVIPEKQTTTIGHLDIGVYTGSNNGFGIEFDPREATLFKQKGVDVIDASEYNNLEDLFQEINWKISHCGNKIPRVDKK